MATESVDLKTDLLPFVKEKKYHRALFDGGIFNSTEKKTFTILDFWRHYIIATIGSREAAGRMGDYTKQDRLALIESIIGEQRPLRKLEAEYIYKIVKKHGLQIVLFAVDEISLGEQEQSGLPRLDVILDFIKSGSVYLHKLLREDKGQ